jgi:hypothetical protein
MSLLPIQCGCPCHAGGHCSGICCDNVGTAHFDEDVPNTADRCSPTQILVGELIRLQKESAGLLVFAGRYEELSTASDEHPPVASVLSGISRTLMMLKQRVRDESKMD